MPDKQYLKPVGEDYPHLGDLLSTRVKKSRISQAYIHKKLQVNRNSLSRYYKNKSVQAGILWNIGIIINHNFFAELGALMPVPFEHTDLEQTIQDLKQQIIAKDDQIRDLEKELAIYKGIVLRS